MPMSVKRGEEVASQHVDTAACGRSKAHALRDTEEGDADREAWTTERTCTT